jgi:hypothetical protein
VQSGPSSHRAADLWLATALPLTAERAVSTSGCRRGNEGLKRGENKPNKEDERIPESTGAGKSFAREEYKQLLTHCNQ